MDVLTDEAVGKKRDAFGENRDNDGFWVICTANGVVSICSRGASDFGITAGVTTVSELIHKRDIAAFDDLIRRGSAGGDVSAELAAADGIGFSVVHLKGVRLFSSFGAEMRFYRSKEEYLAASVTFGERLGRVFNYIDHFTSDVRRITERLQELSDESPALRDTVGMLSELNNRIADEGRFITGCYRDTYDPDERVCDIPAIFGCIARLYENESKLPFGVSFRDMTGGGNVIADTDPERVTGIVMMAATVAARLSKNNACTVTLSGDGDFVYIEAESRLRDEYRLFGRSEDLGNIYRCIPANPIELMVLEHLCAVPEWRIEYSADENRSFTVRAALFWDTNPDRLRYRDCTATVGDTFRRYSDYIRGSFLPDPQEQSED